MPYIVCGNCGRDFWAAEPPPENERPLCGACREPRHSDEDDVTDYSDFDEIN